MTRASPRFDVVFRCDGGHAVGLGHVKRCLAVAAILRDAHGLDCALAGAFSTAAGEVVHQAGIEALGIPSGADEAEWLGQVVRYARAQVLVCDVRTDLPPRALLKIKRDLALLVTLDDASERRLVSDIALLPPTEHALSLPWPDFRGEALIGWAWVVLAAPADARGATRVVREPPYQILVTMGGADPFDLTARLARNLRVFAENIMPHFVIGPAFNDADALIASIRGMWPCGRIYQDLPDLRAPIREADLAICTYGVTALELAAAGVPALYLSLTPDHAQSADALAATGAGQNLGCLDALKDEDIRMQISRSLRNAQARERMSVAGPRAIDGCGAQRIAERIMRAMKARAA